jgi:hypothetical protein
MNIENVFAKGQNYLIRTVTMIDLGTVVDVVEGFVVLEGGGWVADTGRFSTCLAAGGSVFLEYEKAPGKIYVSLSAIVDVFPWSHELPAETK